MVRKALFYVSLVPPVQSLTLLIDEHSFQPRKFLIQVEPTLEALLNREDTDRNMQITIDDHGPKVRKCRGALARKAG
jgi:hypothetical protein